jgi:hypothetical protein
MRSTADVIGGKPIAVSLQSISGVSVLNPLVAFYDIHGRKREVLFFYFVPDITRDTTRDGFTSHEEWRSFMYLSITHSFYAHLLYNSHLRKLINFRNSLLNSLIDVPS